jgi:hypothetical protein
MDALIQGLPFAFRQPSRKPEFTVVTVLTLLLGIGVSTATPASGLQEAPVTMHLDYAGAETIIRALERDSLSDADVDELLRIHGVRAAMIDNVTRFIPDIQGAPEFRTEIQTFVRTKQGGDYAGIFQLPDVWRERSRIRELITAVRGDESRIVREALALLEPYRPTRGPLPIRVYFIAGGVSTGFAFEHDVEAFYINLARAQGDYYGIIWNMVHEAYHVMQMVAQQQSGTFTAWITDETVPPVQRLLAGTLVEGTATLVADPRRLNAPEGTLQTVLDRYRRSAEPARIAENFAMFDTVLQGLREGRTEWADAVGKGFSLSSEHEERFYFVGYEMAKAIEDYCGTNCIGRLFEEPPVEFFASISRFTTSTRRSGGGSRRRRRVIWVPSAIVHRRPRMPMDRASSRAAARCRRG